MIRNEALKRWVARRYEGHLYFDHCVAVAEKAAPFADFAYEVGLCHDLIEDGLATVEVLRTQLLTLTYLETETTTILGAVIELTDVFTKISFPEMSKKQRREQENTRLTEVGALAQTVKYADLIDGARWVHENRPVKWSEYRQRKIKLLRRLNKGAPALRDEAINVFKASFSADK